jgi:hypothetical protein
MQTKTLLIVGLLAQIWVSAECVLAGEIHTEKRVIEREGAEHVAVRVDIPGGKFAISGGAKELLQAKFEYENSEWAPVIDYQVQDGKGTLELSVANKKSWDWDFSDEGEQWNSDGDHNKWNLQFSDEVPLALSLQVGAMDGDLDLRGLTLQGLSMEVGAGSIDMDLRGHWTDNTEAVVEVGAGDLVLKLPADIGIAVVVESGVGSVNISGLTKTDGQQVESEGFEISFLGFELKSPKGGWFNLHLGTSGVWTNETYGQSDTNLRLRVKLGIGALNVVVVQ